MSEKKCLFYYGAAKGRTEVIAFVSRKKPTNFKYIYEIYHELISSKEAFEKTAKIIERINNEYYSLNDYNIQPGSVVHHIDDGNHVSIVIDINGDFANLLFVTSNPRWNNQARKISVEESALLGFKSNNVNSYLAPVIRSILDCSSRGIIFPDYRVNDFRKEFKWG